MGVVGEQGVQAGVLACGEEAGAGVQGAAGGVQRVAGTAAVAVERLLDTTADVVEGFDGEAYDVERIHDRDRVREFFVRGGLEAGEPVHRDDVDAVAPGLVALGQPLFDLTQVPTRTAARPATASPAVRPPPWCPDATRGRTPCTGSGGP